jgi:hypothetical protein
VRLGGWIAGVVLGTLAGAAWTQQAAAPRIDEAQLLEESRKVALDLVTQVRGELTRALEFSGPLRAIVVCKYSVPEITSNLSRSTGWRVTRVTLRPRNPALGSADAWEQKVLIDFERRVEHGEHADDLEYREVVTEPQGRFFRYMKALPVGLLCVSCHGPPDRISEAVKAQIGLDYKGDKAVSYLPGQVRGAVSIKRPL